MSAEPLDPTLIQDAGTRGFKPNKFYFSPPGGGDFKFSSSDRPIYLVVDKALRSVSANAHKFFNLNDNLASWHLFKNRITVRFEDAGEMAKNIKILDKLKSFKPHLADPKLEPKDGEWGFTRIEYPDLIKEDNYTFTCRVDEYCALEHEFRLVMIHIDEIPSSKGFINIPRQVKSLAKEYLKLFQQVREAVVSETNLNGMSHDKFLQMKKQVGPMHRAMFKFLQKVVENSQTEPPDVKSKPTREYLVVIDRDQNISTPRWSVKLTLGLKKTLYVLALLKGEENKVREFAKLYDPSLEKASQDLCSKTFWSAWDLLRKVFPGIRKSRPQIGYFKISGLKIKCEADPEAVKAVLGNMKRA